MSTQQQLIWAIVIVLVLGGGYWLVSNQNSPVKSDDGTPIATDAADDAGSSPASPTAAGANSAGAASGGTAVSTGAPMSASVSYDGISFTPANVTIAKGGTVTFTSTAPSMWIASAPHPAHTGYDGTDRPTHCAAGYAGPKPFDQCRSGTTYSFTFGKPGSWKYHDHMNASAFGSVTVE